ncbi:MAG: hypothetical protein ING84_16055 [Cytophagales bacterium]|jgi:hypothetical protein|nr:hypothetical protein [Cytophagales bacterium]MCA6367001.1 hypothetical protein [Cytophagales bacterium]MCA6370549.1 hypothetical protein [Cytophagales bacterium]MCA6375446.1 hypothetical protein [Cytophagales bacterium]MCA6382159.1 hypothetical protein [Cytophagales bacterium]
MSWTTVYVKGNVGFEGEVIRHLEKSGFSFLPGSGSENEFSLFWINDRAQLREFKKAITAKTIFKYRLRFYPDMAAAQNSNAGDFTASEEALVKEMRDWQKAYNQELRNSA